MALVFIAGYLDVSLLYHIYSGIVEKTSKKLELKPEYMLYAGYIIVIQYYYLSWK